MKKIKVLVVDDANFMIKAVSEILNSDDDIEVVGSAKNGLQALEKIKELAPDVITLDVDMPIMDGLRAVRHIMLECPVPIVMLSSLFSNGAITFEALRLGVVDFLPKPSGAISQNIHTAKQQIIDRIKNAMSVNIHNIHRVRVNPINEANKLQNYGFQTLEYLLLIGTNLGGPNTNIRIFSTLSPKLATAAIIVQEISPKMLPAYVKEFDKYARWTICEATDGAVLEAGVCYVASNEYTLNIEINRLDQAIIKISERVDKPLDKLFISAASVFGTHTIGVLLTGIGDDGSKGFREIKAKAGVTIAQQSNTCVYPNLTECAIEQGVVDKVLLDKNLPSGIEALIKEHAARLS
ncbi:MAG: chemotaxis protein CheB [Methylococcales bacterium]